MKNFKGKYYIHRDSVMSIYNSTNYGTTRSMTLLRLFLSHADLQINSTVVKVDCQLKEIGHEKHKFFTVTRNRARIYIMDIPKCPKIIS